MADPTQTPLPPLEDAIKATLAILPKATPEQKYQMGVMLREKYFQPPVQNPPPIPVNEIPQPVKGQEFVQPNQTGKGIAAIANLFSPSDSPEDMAQKKAALESLSNLGTPIKKAYEFMTDPNVSTMQKVWELADKASVFMPGSYYGSVVEKATSGPEVGEATSQYFKNDPAGVVIDAIPGAMALRGTLKAGLGVLGKAARAGKYTVAPGLRVVDTVNAVLKGNPAVRQTFLNISKDMHSLIKAKLPRGVKADVGLLTTDETMQLANLAIKHGQEPIEAAQLYSNPEVRQIMTDITRKAVDRGVRTKAVAQGSGRPWEDVYAEAMRAGQSKLFSGKPPVDPSTSIWGRRLFDVNRPLTDLQSEMLKAGNPAFTVATDLEARVASTAGRISERVLKGEDDFVRPLQDMAKMAESKFGVKPAEFFDDLASRAVGYHAPVRNIVSQQSAAKKAGQKFVYDPDNPLGSGFTWEQARLLRTTPLRKRGKEYYDFVKQADTFRKRISDETLHIRGEEFKGTKWAEGAVKKYGPTYTTLRGQNRPGLVPYEAEDILDASDLLFGQQAATQAVGNMKFVPSYQGKAAKGRIFPTGENTVFNTVADYYTTLRAAEKNALMNRLLQVADRSQLSGVWKVLKPAQVRALIQFRGSAALEANEVRAFVKESGGRIAEYRILFEPGFKPVVDALRVAGVDSLSTALKLGDWAKTFFKAVGAGLTATPETGRIGQKVGAASLRLSERIPGGKVDPLGWLARRAATNLTTRDPFFPVRNAFKDIQYSLMLTLGHTNSGLVTRQAAANFFNPHVWAGLRGQSSHIIQSGYFKGKTWSQVMQSYINHGGRLYHSTGVVNPSMDPTKFIHNLQASSPGPVGTMIGGINKGLESLNTTSELVTKVSTFEALCSWGLKESQAAQFAMNAGVNFAKRGSWAPFINSLWLFSSVNLQSGARWISAWANNPRFRQLFFDLATYSFTYHTMLRFAMSTDSTGTHPLDRQTTQQKLRGFPILTSWTGLHQPDQQPFSSVWTGFGPVSLSLGIGRLFSDAIFSEGVNKVTPEVLMAGILTATLDSIFPLQVGEFTGRDSAADTMMNTLLPTAAATATAIPRNKGTFGQAINKENEYTQNYADVMKGFEKVSIYQDAAYFIDDLLKQLPIQADTRAKWSVSPGTIQWGIQNPFLIPGWTRQSLDLINYVKKQMHGDPEQSARLPFLGALAPLEVYGSTHRHYAQIGQEVQKFKGMESGMKKMREGDNYKLRMENTELSSFANRYNAVSRLIGIKNSMLQRRNLSDQERAQTLNFIFLKQQQIITEYNQLLQKLESR